MVTIRKPLNFSYSIFPEYIFGPCQLFSHCQPERIVADLEPEPKEAEACLDFHIDAAKQQQQYNNNNNARATATTLLAAMTVASASAASSESR